MLSWGWDQALWVGVVMALGALGPAGQPSKGCPVSPARRDAGYKGSAGEAVGAGRGGGTVPYPGNGEGPPAGPQACGTSVPDEWDRAGEGGQPPRDLAGGLSPGTLTRPQWRETPDSEQRR